MNREEFILGGHFNVGVFKHFAEGNQGETVSCQRAKSNDEMISNNIDLAVEDHGGSDVLAIEYKIGDVGEVVED